MTTSRSAPIAALVAMVLIWGYTWVLMKVALRFAHPFDFAALRTGLGAAVLFALVKLHGRGLAMRRYRMAIVLGILQVATFTAPSQTALLFAGPGKTSVLVFTMPFWLIVFAHFLIGFVALSILALAHPHAPILWAPEFVLTLAFVGVFASAIGWWLWTYVLSHSSAGVAGLNSLGIPVIAVLASAIQLGERPTPLELAGMLLIGCALALLAWLGLKPQAASRGDA